MGQRHARGRAGERVLSGSHAGPLYLWALTAFPERRGLAGPSRGHGIEPLAIGPDGERAVVRRGGGGGPWPLSLVETRSGAVLCELAADSGEDAAAWFSPDGRCLVVRAGAHFVVFDLAREVELGCVPAAWRLPARLSPDGAILLHPEGPPGTVSLWDVRTGQRARIAGRADGAATGPCAVGTPDTTAR